jgi:hypothetical protein
MKTYNSSSRNSKQTKSEAEDLINGDKGITKVLLEKYKPKVLHDLEDLSIRKAKRILA